MYRPTVRYSDVYRTYVDDLFKATNLDRNKIIRCALFTAARNPDFLKIMNHYQKKDVPLPSPLWRCHDDYLWMEQDVEYPRGAYSDIDERERTNASSVKILGTSEYSRTLPKPIVKPKKESVARNETSERSRRLRPAERRTRTLPTVQFSNTGGIKIDLR